MANDTVEKVRGQTETDIEVQKDQLLTVDRQRVENRIGVEEIHKWWDDIVSSTEALTV